ncbi:hypothetical protein V6N13_036125 [Hibiscus sabdariffa]|uniref:Uncharacterized protein n=1 Tax=Hibiscus sabdariffa TaxID=183260 RepID=A0ABR2S848_9ROSI
MSLVPIGHFREKTAILSTTQGKRIRSKGSRFQVNYASRRSPDQALTTLSETQEVQKEEVEVWRMINRRGTEQASMKRRVAKTLKWKMRWGLLGLLLKAMVSLLHNYVWNSVQQA